MQDLLFKHPIFLEIWLVKENSEGRSFFFNKQLIQDNLQLVLT